MILPRIWLKKEKNDVYPLLYPLLTLALMLHVVTVATVDRVFFAMHFVKTCMRNRIKNHLWNDTVIVYVENDIFNGLDNETIMQ